MDFEAMSPKTFRLHRVSNPELSSYPGRKRCSELVPSQAESKSKGKGQPRRGREGPDGE
jgi:hypothetical protein